MALICAESLSLCIGGNGKRASPYATVLPRIKPASKYVSFCRIGVSPFFAWHSDSIMPMMHVPFFQEWSNVRNSCCTHASLVVDKPFNVLIPSSSGIHFRKTCHSRRLSPTSFIGDLSSGIQAFIPNGIPVVQPASVGENNAGRWPASNAVATPTLSFRPPIVILSEAKNLLHHAPLTRIRKADPSRCSG